MDDISCGGVLKAKIIKNQKQFYYFNITQKRKFFKRMKKLFLRACVYQPFSKGELSTGPGYTSFSPTKVLSQSS